MLDLAAGGQEDEVELRRLFLCDVPAFEGALAAVFDGDRREEWQVLAREREERRARTWVSAATYAPAVSSGSAGRMTSRFGITRRPGIVSTGSWVGPSSPTADGVVREDVRDREVAQRGEADGRAAVVREDEEGRAARAEDAVCAMPFMIGHMPCSRMPKRMLRPERCFGLKSSLPASCRCS